MIFSKKFDLVISLGEDCACAMYLKKFKLRDASYPFDWLCHATFEKRIELLENDFAGFMQKENLRWFAKPTTGLRDLENDNYEDTETGFYFYHDFKEGEPLDTIYPAVKEKYDRRIARLYRKVSKADNVLFVWRTSGLIPLEKISDAQKRLSLKFKKNIYLLSVQNAPSQKDITWEKSGEYTVRATGSITDNEGSTMGDQIISDRIFSEIKIPGFNKERLLAKKILVKLLCVFVPSKPLRRKIRHSILD